MSGTPTVFGAAARGRMTPNQVQVFDELLAIGGPRPLTRAGLVQDLTEIISDGTSGVMTRWPEKSLWVGKSAFTAMFRCEAQVIANQLDAQVSGIHRATAIGIVAHRAIQMAYTHGDRTPRELINMATAGSLNEQKFREFWDGLDEWGRSETTSEAMNRLVSFLDTFPPIEDTWVPQFEASMSTRVGRVTLSGKPDLMLGRPRADGRQTMLLCDFKTGNLNEEHLLEARFYALVAALRFGVAPFRSCVMSLASGEWTEPDVTSASLRETASDVADAIRRRVEILTEERDPTYGPGRHCGWCIAHDVCSGRDGSLPATPVAMSLGGHDDLQPTTRSHDDTCRPETTVPASTRVEKRNTETHQAGNLLATAETERRNERHSSQQHDGLRVEDNDESENPWLL